MVELKTYRITNIEFKNQVKNNTQLQLRNQVKYNVNYMESVNKCVGILSFRIEDADLNPFEFKLDIIADFSYDVDDEKPDIHTGSFDQLFPYVRMIVSTVTNLAGIPGLNIPTIKLNKNTVNIAKPDDGETSPLN